jgi:CRP/FNR family transcriptional regulator
LIANLCSRLQPIEQHFVSRVLAACTRIRIDAGQSRGAADFDGSRLLVVEFGAVAKVSATGTGRRMLLTVAGQGDLLSAPWDGQRLLAIDSATVIPVTKAAQHHLLGCQPVAEAIVGALLERLREREESLAQFGNVAHVERVRRKLLQLARLHGTRVDGGVLVELPLTQALLAEMVGSARETVSGAVGTLEREGFLTRDSGRYTVKLPV